MSQRLTHLKTLLAGKSPTRPTDKTDESPPSVSFVSGRGSHFSHGETITEESVRGAAASAPPDACVAMNAPAAERGLPQELTKLTEGPFVSFVSDRGKHLSIDEVVLEGRTGLRADPASHRTPARMMTPSAGKVLPEQLTKLTKGSSVSFVSDQVNGILRDEGSRQDAIAAFDERAAICEYDGGLLREQAESLAALHSMPLPAGVNENTRTAIIDAAARFLDQRRRSR